MAGCASNDSYEIKGEVKDADLEGAKIYKAEYVCPVKESDNTLITDSTTIQNGKYTFSGTITDPAYCTLYTKPGSSKNGKSIFAVITLEKGKINVHTEKSMENCLPSTEKQGGNTIWQLLTVPHHPKRQTVCYSR